MFHAHFEISRPSTTGCGVKAAEGALFGRYVLSFWNENENQTLLGIDDQKGIQGYIDRSKIRDAQGTKFMRELILK